MNDEKEQSSTGVGSVGEGRQENADGGREVQAAGGAGCASQEAVEKRGVLEILFVEGVNSAGNLIVRVRCYCGKEFTSRRARVASGYTKSCGCLRATSVAKRNKTHGLTHHPLFVTWRNIKKRCLDVKNPNYPYYGGRGITMSKEWSQSLLAFARDMGDKPSPEHSIERIDNGGGYSRENCIWATRSEQLKNMRSNVWLLVRGIKMIASEAVGVLGIHKSSLFGKINRARITGENNFIVGNDEVTVLYGDSNQG